VVARIELDPVEVVEVEDHGKTPIPMFAGEYIPERFGPKSWRSPSGLREDVKPLNVVQPEGPSFTVDGHQIRWQKWSLRVGFTAREGLVLHQISYDDGRERPVIYRASLAEMFVPYGDPAPTHYRRNVFDQGEVGLGLVTNSLALGCDCLGDIHYFDADLVNGAGETVRIENAICLHEEDAGLAWKHTDAAAGTVEVRRLRRLVISFICTVDNYEYAFYWHLYQDGSIELDVGLTGIILTGATEQSKMPQFGTPVAPGLYGPNHQHQFCVRLDMSVDGLANTVEEVDSRLIRGKDGNPYGNAWEAVRTVLDSESRGQRAVDPTRARHWRVINRSCRNALGRPTGYRLEPGPTTMLLQHPDAPTRRRAEFATKSLWVTRYKPRERYAAGDYPNQHQGGGGLPEYVADDEPLEDTDVVVWYSFGVHHVVRCEDWPVMPVTRHHAFRLKPDGFFDVSPALDLPRPGPHCAHQHPKSDLPRRREVGPTSGMTPPHQR
jgi:primary-amine oxidase